MKETIKEIIEKAVDFFFKLTKKFDKISEAINQKTGAKINVGMIILGAILVIFLFIFVKAILSFLWSLL